MKRTFIYKIWLLIRACIGRPFVPQWIHQKDNGEYYLSDSEQE